MGGTSVAAIIFLGMPTSLVVEAGFLFTFLSQFHLPAYSHCGWQQVQVHALGTLPQTWETWIKLLGPSFRLFNTSGFGNLGREAADERLLLPVCLPASLVCPLLFGKISFI